MREEHLDLLSDGGGVLEGLVSEIGTVSKWLWANLSISMGGRDGLQEGLQGVESIARFRCSIRGDHRSPEGCISAVFLWN